MEPFLEPILRNQWLAAIVIATLLLASAEFGYRIGLRLYAQGDEARRSQVGGVQGAVLALLGLLLGFTYSMGVGRYETRRELVLKEANAIGTTYLRAGLIPEAHSEPARELLRDFVDVRLKAYDLQLEPGKLAEGMRESARIESELWKHAEAAAKEAASPITATFIVALNEMIDTDAERISVGRNMIPAAVWALLAFVAGFGCFTSAYGSGAQGARSAFTSVLLPGLIAIVIFSILDLTQGRQGFIQISQQPMLDLRDSIRKR